MKRKSVVASVAVLCGFVLVGCGQNATSNNTGSSTAKASSSAKQSTDTVSARAYLTSNNKSLKVKDAGAASLTIDKKTQQMTVALELSGLQSETKYTVEVVDQTGAKVYALSEVTANTKGSGVSLTTIKHVPSFAKNWIIEVKHGTAVVAQGAVHS